MCLSLSLCRGGLVGFIGGGGIENGGLRWLGEAPKKLLQWRKEREIVIVPLESIEPVAAAEGH